MEATKKIKFSGNLENKIDADPLGDMPSSTATHESPHGVGIPKSELEKCDQLQSSNSANLWGTHGKKIAIVAGVLTSPRLLTQFEVLAKNHDVTIYVFDKNDILSSYAGIKLVAYEEVKDMPGYMRGIEVELKRSDAIIALESTCLASFQACRAARKYMKPFVVYSTEWQVGLYEQYPNIKAIQHDILTNADSFFFATEQSRKYFDYNNVEPSKMALVPYAVCTKRFKPSSEARQKFRKYIGLKQDDIVLLHTGNLIKSKNSELVLKMFSLLKNVDIVNPNRLKLIIAGSGEMAKDLKYLSYDLGLGDSIYFLHQSIEPFAQDLYNAVDFVVQPESEVMGDTDPLPFEILDMMACGVIPVFVAGSKEENVVGKSGLIVKNNRHDEMAIAVSRFLGSDTLLAEMKAESVAGTNKVNKDLEPTCFESALIEAFDGFVEQHRDHPRCEADHILRTIHARIEEGNFDCALVDAERILLELDGDEPVRSEVYRAKGDIKYAAGSYDEALIAFQESLQVDPKNAASFRGLGFVAWQSHSHVEAISFFKKSLALSENDSQTMLGLGLVHRRVGLLEEAIYWFEKSLSVEAPSSTAITALTQACGDCKDAEMGIAALERVIDLLGDREALLIGLGGLYIRAGRNSEGRTLIDRALS